MQSVVITGARGYIGNALADGLAKQGCALTLVSRSSQARGGEDSTVVRYVRADLCDEACWHKLLAGAGVVVHLSSRTDLRAAEADPVEDERINIDPLRALVRAARYTASRPRVVFASTVTIVGPEHANPVDEMTPDSPCSVYDRHKLACEVLLHEAAASGVLQACSLRLSNVYGYGQASTNVNRGVLNSMMARATRGETLTIYGEGKYARDFIHLKDVVEAFCAAVASDRVWDGSHYVVATGEGHTLAEAFDLIAEEARLQTGYRIEIRHVPEPADLRRIERRNFVGDPRLFQERTGWRPTVDLRTGIRDYFMRDAASRVTVAGR